MSIPPADSTAAGASSVQRTRSLSTFAVHYLYRDDVDGLDRVRPAHREFLGALAEGGILLGSGPYTDEGTFSSLLIMRADGADSLATLLNDDPFAAKGLIEKREIRAWTLTTGPWSRL